MPRYRCVTCGHEFLGGQPIRFGSFTDEDGVGAPRCPKGGSLIGTTSDQWHVVTLAAQIAETISPPVEAPKTIIAPVMKPMPIRPPKVNTDKVDGAQIIKGLWNLIRTGGHSGYKAARKEYEYGATKVWSDGAVRAAIDIWLGYNDTAPMSADEVQRAFYSFHIPGRGSGSAKSWAGSAKNDGSEARKGNVQTNFVCLRKEGGVERRHNLHVTHRSSFKKSG